MSKKKLVFIVAVVFLTSLSCSLNICGYRQDYEREQMSDTNWITQASDTYSYWRREGNVLPNNAVLHFSRFFGKESLWTIEVFQDGYLHITCSISSNQGPFEVVLVQTSTKQVLCVAKQQGPVDTKYFLTKGIYSIKILGYDASGSITMALSYPQGISSNVSTMRF